jgi:cytochrome c oxidase cbb3-type subunit 3
MKNRLIKIATLIFPFLIISGGKIQAQDLTNGGMSTNTAFYIVAGFVFVIALIVLVVAVMVFRLLKFIVKQDAIKKAEEAGITLVEEAGWWSKFFVKANDLIPIEKEDTILLDHNYDGIRELDNHLPPWWKWLFYLSIVFAVVYMLGYHVIGNMPLPEEEYNNEMAIANEAALLRLANAPVENIDQSNVVLVEDPEQLALGKKVYMSNCSQCHKELGEGGIGPNLTDEYWIHGGSIGEIFTTIKVGIPAKGMISWASILSPTQMQNVTSYIVTLKGTNPPNAKAPQGDLYTPAMDSEDENIVADSLQVTEVN